MQCVSANEIIEFLIPYLLYQSTIGYQFNGHVWTCRGWFTAWTQCEIRLSENVNNWLDKLSFITDYVILCIVENVIFNFNLSTMPVCTVPNSHLLDSYIVLYLVLYLTSLQLVLCRVAAVKRLPVNQP